VNTGQIAPFGSVKSHLTSSISVTSLGPEWSLAISQQTGIKGKLLCNFRGITRDNNCYIGLTQHFHRSKKHFTSMR